MAHPTALLLAEASTRFSRDRRGKRVVDIVGGTFPIFDSPTGTGCNIEFCPQEETDPDDVYRLKINTHSKEYIIRCSRREWYMADAIVTWFKYPEEARIMMRNQ
jgi:hypothetical protein